MTGNNSLHNTANAATNMFKPYLYYTYWPLNNTGAQAEAVGGINSIL